MASSNPATVLVFGATGGIGSFAAAAAHKHGAKVVMSMRDTSKKLPDNVSDLGLDRVQADLDNPESIRVALKECGATRALAYLSHNSKDSMKTTWEALKEGGVDFVVFISSATIQKPVEDFVFGEDPMIPTWHAKAEIECEKVFGKEECAFMRGGYFAKNVTWLKSGIDQGTVKLSCPDNKFDYVTEDDMGAVCGKILAEGKAPDALNGGNRINVLGPQLLTQREVVAKLSKALRKVLKIESISSKEDVDFRVKTFHLPENVAEQLVQSMVEATNGRGTYGQTEGDKLANSVKLFRDYVGREPTKFDDWLERNIGLFKD